MTSDSNGNQMDSERKLLNFFPPGEPPERRKDDITWLHRTCTYGNREMATKLTEKLLNYCKNICGKQPEQIIIYVNMENKKGKTALQLAKENMNMPLIQLLLENGADITCLKKSNLAITDDLFDKVLLRMYDNAVTQINNVQEPENHFAWEFDWDFEPVTGFTYVKPVIAANSTDKEPATEIQSVTDPAILTEIQGDLEVALEKVKESSNEFLRALEQTIRANPCSTTNLGDIEGSIKSEKQSSRPTDNELNFIKLNQTRTLTLLLRGETASTNKLFQHPLVRVFLESKEKKFMMLLYLSMLYHIIWSAVSFVYIFCNTHILDSTNIVNTTRDSNLTELCQSFKMFHGDSPTEFFSSWVFYFVFLLYISSIIKEAIEFFSCEDMIYYILQLGNMGQWLVNFTVFIVWLVNVILRWDGHYEDPTTLLEKSQYLWKVVLPSLYIFGMFASLLLVQVELGKIQILSRNIEMFVEGFKKVALFLLAFLPLLTAFLFTFHLLLPMRPEFVPSWGLGFAKILSMMTGEVNYDDTFYGADEDDIAFRDVLKVFVLVFIVVVVILLQNLLIAINVSDGGKLEETSKVRDLTSTLEEIYLMENMLTKEWVITFMKKVCGGKNSYTEWYNANFVVNEKDFLRKYPDCKCENCHRIKWYKQLFPREKNDERKNTDCLRDMEKESEQGKHFMRLTEYSKETQSIIVEWIKSRHSCPCHTCHNTLYT